MPSDSGPLKSPATYLEAYHQAGQNIAKVMAVIPEDQLVTAIYRNFRVWPYRASSTSASLLHILQTIVDNVRTAAGAEIAALGVGRFPNHPFDPWVVSGVSEDLRTKLRAPCPVGTLATVAIGGQKIRIKDIRDHPDYKGFPDGHPPLKSLLAMPIRFGKVSLGNLYLGNKIGHVEFSQEDELIVESLSEMIVVAIQQNYLRSALETRQSQVQALLDSFPSGVLFVDKLTESTTANQAAMELFQSPFTEAALEAFGSTWAFDAEGAALEPSERPSRKALAGATVLGQEMQVKRPDGTMIPIRVNASPVFDTHNEILGAVLIFENISLEKRVEQMRQRMAATIVHDIRNPLQAALINARIIRDWPGIDPQLGARSRLIEESLHRITRMSNRLLEAARIESTQINLDLRVIELREFVKGVVAQASSAYLGRQIDVQVPEEGIWLKLDSDRMDQVITNLIDNAAKYSPEGSRIEVGVTSGLDGPSIRVRDHGPGLAPELVTHLFDPFKRGAASQSLAPGGLGLGLYIVKGIVEAHGGKVIVESTPGKGTVFRLNFPASLREQIAA